MPPTPEFVPPTREFVPPTPEFVPPTPEFVPPIDFVPPTPEFVPPREFVPPTPEFVPPNLSPPPAAVPTPAVLELSDATIGPGNDVTATGLGCVPNAPVSLSIGEIPVGQSVADPAGGFETALTTGSVELGRHQVMAQCGRTLSAPLDVVLVSHVGTGTSTVTVVLLFLLLGGWFYGHRLATHLTARRNVGK